MKFICITIMSIIFFGCGSTVRFSSEKPESKTRHGTSRALETVTGTASYYADDYHGKTTANGEIYNMYDLTAAHNSYPFNTIVRITNLSNNKVVELRINDRMPEFKGRILDVSYRAAKDLDMIISGIAEVKLEVLKWGSE